MVFAHFKIVFGHRDFIRDRFRRKKRGTLPQQASHINQTTNYSLSFVKKIHVLFLKQFYTLFDILYTNSTIQIVF